MDTIAKTIERLVKGEYGRPAPLYFQRAIVELLQVVCKAMRESLEAEASKGQKIPLSKTAIGHFPIEDWDWGAPPEPVLTSTVEHFKRELPLVVRTLPDAFAVNVPRNTYLTLARGAVHWYKDTPGPLTAYHLYLTPEEVEELKRIEEKWRRELFISTKYISHSLYSTSWPLTWYGVDYKRTLDVSFGPIQVQEARRWAHLVVSFHVSTFRTEIPSMGPDGKYETLEEPPVPLELTAEELASHIAELENVLAGKGPLQGPLSGELALTSQVPGPVLRAGPELSRDLGECWDPGLASLSSDLIPDAVTRRDIAERRASGKGVVVQTGPSSAYEAEESEEDLFRRGKRAWTKRTKAEERRERKKYGPDGVKRERPTPSREDFIRMGLSEISLGTLGLHISLALFKLAWEQRDTASVPGEIVLKSWNHLCREVNPRFDELQRGAQSNYRRRVQRKIMDMTRLRLYLKYNKLGKPCFVNTMWIKRYEREEGSNTIILELGVYNDLYLVPIANRSLHLLDDGRLSENARKLLIKLLGETWPGGGTVRYVATLIEWGDWKSHDQTQNKRSLAQALALFVELGYLKEATLLPDGEKYHLVRQAGHDFTRKLKAAKPEYASKPPPKAYRRKRDKPDLPGGGDK